MYHDDGNENRIGRNGWEDPDNSFNYNIIDASMWLWYKDERVSLGEYSRSTVRREHAQGGRGCGCESCRWCGRGKGQEHRLNKKVQLFKERADCDLNSVKTNFFPLKNSMYDDTSFFTERTMRSKMI